MSLDVSILIPTWGRAEPLARCLAAVVASAEASGARYEILTIHAPDDGASMAMVKERFPRVAVHATGERNLALQRNVGAQNANGAIVVYIDDDAWPQAPWLQHMLAPFRETDVGAVGGRVLSEDGSPQVEAMAVTRFGRQRALAGDGACPDGYYATLAGGNFAVRRDALLAVGGFDENYRYHYEDTDFQLRLHDAGLTLRYEAGAAVYHEQAVGPHRRSRYDRDWKTIVANTVYFAFRHVKRGRFRLWFVPVLMQIPKTARAIAWLFRGRLGWGGLGRFLSGQCRGLWTGYRMGRSASPRLPFLRGVS